MQLPDGVVAMAGRGQDWAAWVDRLPRLVADLVQEWELEIDGESTHGFTALVLPVRSDQGDAVLKVVMPGTSRSTRLSASSDSRATGRCACCEPIRTATPCCSSGYIVAT